MVTMRRRGASSLSSDAAIVMRCIRTDGSTRAWARRRRLHGARRKCGRPRGDERPKGEGRDNHAALRDQTDPNGRADPAHRGGLGLRPDPPDSRRSGIADARRSRGSRRASPICAQRLGLDQSLPIQFVIWFGNVLQGDLGQSITSQPAGPAAGAGPLLDQRADRPHRRPDRQRDRRGAGRRHRRLAAEQRCSTSPSSAPRRCCSRSRPSGSACCSCCSSA